MASARRLTEEGTEVLEKAIDCLRVGQEDAIPVARLNDAPLSVEFCPGFEVDRGRFETRYDFGRYLLRATDGVERSKVVTASGLMNWLTAYYFDQICPLSDEGKREVRETARYVHNPHFRRYHRHVVLSSYDLTYLHGHYSEIMLYSPLDTHNDFLEQMGGRQDIVSLESVVEVAHRLYWDRERKRPKIKASSRNEPGSVRRLIEFVYQLDLTYDVGSLTAQDILPLLPSEFDRWR